MCSWKAEVLPKPGALRKSAGSSYTDPVSLTCRT
jgi:hypothetical protein